MHRRSFLRLLSAALVGSQIPLIPGVPAIAPIGLPAGPAASFAEINRVTAAVIMPAVRDAFLRETPILALLKKHR